MAAARDAGAALMPPAILALLLSIGCQVTEIQTPIGPAAVVLVCPAPVSAPAELKWVRSYFLRGVTSLPVRF